MQFNLNVPAMAATGIAAAAMIGFAADARAADAPAAPAGYEVLAASDAGKSLLARKAGVTSIKAALESTFPELAKYFGNDPVVGKAFADANDPKHGGATFTARVDGQAVQGFIKCAIDDAGATVAVIYCRPGASKADLDGLLNAGPAAAPGAGAAAAADNPATPLKRYDFPDGTGSVGLADGWTTKTQSAADPIGIAGPANQFIVLNNGRNISTPDSLEVRNRQQMQAMQQRTAAQMDANARQMARMTGRPYQQPNLPPPRPLPPPLVAPLLDPVEALKALVPQFSAQAEFNHGPRTTLDQVISSEDLPPGIPGGKTAKIVYEMTTATADGKPLHLRRQMKLTTAPFPGAQPQAWFWFVTDAMAAPVDTFDRDLPVMQAMVKSIKVDQDRLAEVTKGRIQQMQESSRIMAEANAKVLETQRQIGQDNMRTQQNIHNMQYQAQQDRYRQHNMQWANDEWQKQRNAADFQEYIIGTRTVRDTKTGESGTADLSSAVGVADALNQATLDPNRFVAVPLRDELYPTPPAAPAR